MHEKIDLQTIKLAEKDAKKLIEGDTSDYELVFRMRIAKEIGIGIWDSYFDNLTLYKLAFEAFLYAGLQEKQHGKDPEQEAEELINMLKSEKENMIMPSGFGFDSESDEESEYVEIPLKDLSGLS